MPKSFFRVPGTSSSTENGSNDSNDDDDKHREKLQGPDTEFENTLKRIFSSTRRNLESRKSFRTVSPTRSKRGVVVPLHQTRRCSVDDDNKTGVNLREIIAASVLELFFSTVPSPVRDKIKTMFIDFLCTAGVSSRTVFSPLYESSRFKLARMMHGTILQTFMSMRLSRPTIDDRLSSETPTFVADPPTRYNEDFEEIKEIGTGGFGRVYQSKSKVDGQIYAIKKILLKKSTEKDYQKMLDECRFHASLQHANIVRYHNAWVDVSYQSYQTDFRPPSPEVRTVRIRSLSTTHSGVSPHISSDVVIEDNNQGSGNCSDEDDESSSSSSSSNSKGKRFWAKKRSSAGDSSFVSFSTNEHNEDEEVEEEEDDDVESITSNDSLDSNSAKMRAKELARNDYDDLSSRDLQLAMDVSDTDLHFIVFPTLFIQMELLSVTLEKYLRHRQKHLLSIDININESIVEGLLSAVAFLHRHSVVHRDIKPSNIFIKKTPDRQIMALLGDFGLARGLELALVESSSPTPEEDSKLTGGLGTYLYAAPEQLDSIDYSLSADIYSSGVVIYELYHDFKTGSERVITLMELKKTFQLSPEFKKAWPKLSPILSSMIAKEPSQRHEAKFLLAKFKELKKIENHENEVQLLRLENERLRAEAELWKERYLELERRFKNENAHDDQTC